MSNWAPKRFWKTAAAVPSDDGWTVQLDERPVRTPAKALLQVPTRALAEAAATEWGAQDKAVDPATMPVTCSVNAALDKVSKQFAEVADMLAEYGDSDLTCYRAADPQGLVDRQTAAWDPLLDWAAERFDARLIPVQGVIHHPQPTEALARLRAPLDAMTPFELTAMHDLIMLSGSLVIGLAASEAAQSADNLWALSRIDEDWQQEQWGEDAEASEQAQIKRSAFLQAHRFLSLARSGHEPLNP